MTVNVVVLVPILPAWSVALLGNRIRAKREGVRQRAHAGTPGGDAGEVVACQTADRDALSHGVVLPELAGADTEMSACSRNSPSIRSRTFMRRGDVISASADHLIFINICDSIQ